MSSVAPDPNVLRSVRGYLVADARGRVVGRVEGATPDGDRLAVRGGLPFRRGHVVLAADIAEIDQTSGVVALRGEKEALRPL
jgi:hypothetical protein